MRGESSTVLNLVTWDGASEVWDRSPTNSLIYNTRHKEYRGELVKLTDGTDDHEWTTPQRLVYKFRNPDGGDPNMDGRLLEIRDFNANRVQIAWNEGLGYVNTVTDTAGGLFNFYYNNSQLLTNVTFKNWSAIFAYDIPNRQLLSKSLTNTSGLYSNLNTTWQFQYANPSNGALVRIIDPRGFTNIIVQYDQYGRQTNQVDALNRATATRYGVPGKRQITRVDPGTNSWIETYDRKGRILSQQDPLTNITSYTYDDRGNRTSVTEPLGWKTYFGYDDRANVVARTNALGEITRWEFHAFFNRATNEVNALGWTNHYVLHNNTGNLLQHYDAVGTLVSYAYLSNGLAETSTDANGKITRFAYDTNGFLLAQTDPATNTTSFSVNEVGWKLAQTNALGQVTTFTYDLNGNVVRTVDPLQRVFTKTYDPNGNLLSASDAKGQFTLYAYDPGNQKTNTVDRTGTNISRFFYTSRGKMERTIDPLGNVVSTAYDNANRLIATTDPLGNSVQHIHDPNGNETRMIDQLGQPWSKTYDRLNRVIAESDPQGDTRQTSYDAAGRIKQIITPKGFPSTHTYDGRGRLTKWVDAENFQWLYDYDGNANITNITDALNGRYVMTYGPRNERTLERNQDNFEWHYAYDELLRLKTQQDPNGTIRTPSYDAGGRVLSVGFSTGRTNFFTYDTNSNPTVLTRLQGGVQTTLRFKYDVLDRVTEQTDPHHQIVRYVFDALGRVTTLTYPDNKPLLQRFDALGRMTNQVFQFDAQRSFTNTYAYDKAGRLVRRTYPNGIVQTNAFDTAGQITNLTYFALNPQPSSINLALSYAYDRNGNKTGATEKGTLNWPMPSLTDEKARYTASGRLIDRQIENTTSNQLATINYSYDPSGNMTNAAGNGQTWSFTYDEDNRVLSLHWDCGLTARNIVNRYDSLGRRIARTMDGGETDYVLDLSGSMERILCDLNPDSTISYYVHGPDLCFKVDSDANLTCYHADAMANIISVTDGGGTNVAQYAYAPYGRRLGSTNSQPFTLNAQPFTFVGSQGVMEELPGLYFMRARYYSADAGVFLSTDPMKSIGPGWKPVAYAYVGDNPIRYSDPLGLFAIFLGGNLTGTATAGAGAQLSGSGGIIIETRALFRGDILNAIGIYESGSVAVSYGIKAGLEPGGEIGAAWDGGYGVQSYRGTSGYAGGSGGAGAKASLDVTYEPGTFRATGLSLSGGFGVASGVEGHTGLSTTSVQSLGSVVSSLFGWGGPRGPNGPSPNSTPNTVGIPSQRTQPQASFGNAKPTSPGSSSPVLGKVGGGGSLSGPAVGAGIVGSVVTAVTSTKGSAPTIGSGSTSSSGSLSGSGNAPVSLGNGLQGGTAVTTLKTAAPSAPSASPKSSGGTSPGSVVVGPGLLFFSWLLRRCGRKSEPGDNPKT